MSTRKGGLGRGLDALIPTSVIPQDITTPSGVVVADRNEVDINLISPNPKQLFDKPAGRNSPLLRLRDLRLERLPSGHPFW